MTPSPQETSHCHDSPETPVSRPLSGDEVVITGLSGVFPMSDSVLEFKENLYNKVDMVTDENPRWTFNHPEVPTRLGKINRMNKFDAQFFRVHYKQALTMEPMNRKLLEHAYSAIYDSGLNPQQLRGLKVGVFIGATFTESGRTIIFDNVQRNGFGITGANKAMYSNRISYWMDGKGPSYSLDIACASSMGCLEHAYDAISTGQCDAAIVGGCNLCMEPTISLNLKRAGFLSADGKSRNFDKNSDGYGRSDAISLLFLQKAKDAKRIYSEVYHVKGKYSLKKGSEFTAVREPKVISDFLEAFYSEINVSPKDVEYIEGHGSANAIAESNELQAVAKVFARDTPIKIGSVVSNMGHSEPASGACALTKVCLAYHQGKIAANINFNEPHDEIPAVREGKIQVVQEHTDFGRGFAALNSFSYSGMNIHVLLKGHYKQKDPERYKCSIPRLVFVSGRQDSSVNHVFELLKNMPIDPEQIGLLHGIHERDIPGHMCRGYIILDTNEKKETVAVAEVLDHYPGVVNPVWFVYSGMGSQWAGMGAGLMSIPIFAAAIERCQKVLEPKGIDLLHILTDPDKTIYDNVLHSFVGIAAVQIGLTDILKALGIVPDNIIGHSVGELGCAYADGCFTAEEMILSAYSRGLVSIQTPFIRGSMAAIGLGYEKVLPLCPPEIEVACHNSSDSSTISGPADVMNEFVNDLTNRGIFAKEVPSSNIAYHSRYIAKAGPTLLQYLSEVIKTPKERSSKWVSTSVPQDQWGELKAKYSSAEYHTNNLLNPVLFEETSKLIPANAVVIEVAPHGLLQAILKKSLDECTHIPLTKRGNADPIKYLLEAIGKTYKAGLNPKVDILYPKIEYPVSTETPLLSHFVDWIHSEDWPVAKYNSKMKVVECKCKFVMSIFDDEYKYFKGHNRNGLNIFPEAALLKLVWETLAMYNEVDYREMPVTFKDVKFNEEITIREEVPIAIEIVINKGSEYFQVIYENTSIAEGYIKTSIEFPDPIEKPEPNRDDIVLDSNDIYLIMNQKGWGYKGEFQSIESINTGGTKANVKWTGEWITLLDSLIQLNAFMKNYDGLLTPKIIESLSINIEEHKRTIENLPNETKSLETHCDNLLDVTRCGGIQINNMIFNEKPLKQHIPNIQTKQFVPHFLTGSIDLSTALQINLQVIADNTIANQINITELCVPSLTIFTQYIEEAVTKILDAEFNVLTKQIESDLFDTLIKTDKDVLNSHVIIIDNLLSDEMKVKSLYTSLPESAFVLTVEKDTSNIQTKDIFFDVITIMSYQSLFLMLLKKPNQQKKKENLKIIIIAHDLNFSWVLQVQKELERSSHVVLVSEKQYFYGLKGLIKKLKKEFQGCVSLIVLDDYRAHTFNPADIFYQEQLQKKLLFNVLKHGKWGSYYYVPSPKLNQSRNIKLITTVPGNLESLTWTDAPVSAPSKTSVTVYYTGPSARDVQKAIGYVKSNNEFGMDFSGVTKNGEKVMGIISGGALASTVEADLDLLWPVPKHWSLQDAATVPLPYIHAYYCLGLRTLKRGICVFVTGGAGALGQAVISICLAADCTVFTTVSDINKKKFLLKLFPGLQENNIGYSRDISFRDMIMAGTKNKCCDIVINCNSGLLSKAAMLCGGFGSCIFNMNDYDARQDENFTMFHLTHERNYKLTNMSYIFEPKNVDMRKTLQLMISEGIATGAIKPLSRVIYEPDDIIRAFRFISQSKHRGRVLIRMRDSITTKQSYKSNQILNYSPNHTYLVVFDEIILGIELIDRLVRRGAKKLLVHAKSESLTNYFHYKLQSWKTLGATIKISAENVETEKGCINVINDGMELGPIEGIFVTLKTDRKKDQEVFNPQDAKFKETALIVANLDLMSRNICKELRHFVVLAQSSDNTTDEYSTSVSEKVCELRAENGLPALFYRVNFTDELTHKSSKPHKSPLRYYSSVFDALEISLKMEHNNITSFNVEKKIKKIYYTSRFGLFGKSPMPSHTYGSSRFFRDIPQILSSCSRRFIKYLVDIGLNSFNDIPDDVYVYDLIVNEINIDEIKAVIQETYHITYPRDKIKNMTIASIKNLKYDLTVQNTKFDSGLGAFYTFIDDDECQASEPMIEMRTNLNCNIQNEEEMDYTADFLMLIPGFEGHYRIFKSLSERLKIHPRTFQLGPDLNESISDMANNILKFMRKRYEIKPKFYLLGYSFGVNVALELAALMEKDGQRGIVYCLDSSPDSLRVQLDAYIGNLPDTKLENAIVEHFYKLMSKKDNEKLKKDLENIDTWPEKVKAGTFKLKGLANYSLEYKSSLFNAAYKRIKMAREYRPNFQLESELVLIKGIPHPKSEKLPDDYNLSKYTKQPVKIVNINSDHSMAPQDCRVSNIINSMLEPRLIEEFNKTNLCEVYFAKAYKFF
ncbi:LOW QUALITY PROTEIN: fatty acid synthase-like [Aphomia sociella]